MYRIRLIFALLVVAFIALWARLAYWQIVRYDELSAVAFNQYMGKINVPAYRGKLISADGYPLVVNQSLFRVTADPTLVKIEDRERIADELSRSYVQYLQQRDLVATQRLREASAAARVVVEEKEEELVDGAGLLPLPGSSPLVDLSADDREDEELKARKSTMVAALSDTGRRWVSLLDRVSEPFKVKVEEAKFEGLFFEPTIARGYTDSGYLGYLTGFLHTGDDGQLKGAYGLEAYYDELLRGSSGRVWMEKTVQGHPIPVSHSDEIKAREGYSLHLNINRALQARVMSMLEEGVGKYGALRGDVVVMNPHTGGVIAMASYPGFLPEFFGYAPAETYGNPAIASSYEPGSTFKVLVVAAGIDAGVISPATRCPVCDGPRKVGAHYIKTWNNQYRENPTIAEVLTNSDNTGMVYIGDLLGRDQLYDYVSKFGFGKKSGIDLQEDAVAPLADRGKMREIDFATMTFGQGLAVTPIQMVRAVSVIANGGLLPEPRVVKYLERDGQKVELVKGDWPRVISAESARITKDMMKESAAFGEAKFAYLKGFSIAGKTGTAQVAIDGAYDAKKTIASFVGFAPADDPQFVMLVKLDEPTSSPWGSETAAPLWFAIAKEIFEYSGEMPEK